MQSGKKIAKFATALSLALVMTMVCQGGIMQEGGLKESYVTGAYEVTQKKSAKANAEKATEKVTEKVVKKATKKSTKKEKTTEEPSQAATELPTEAPTEAPTEEPTQYASMTVVEVVPDDVFAFTTQKLNYSVAQPPTEPPTQWSQELQDKYDAQYNAGFLVAIDNPDYTYSTNQVILSDEDRKLACQIVQGEAGGEGFEACCVVAQCLRDTFLEFNCSSIKEVQTRFQYDGWKETYSQDAINAVNFIFDQNRSAVAHRVMFFYATNLCSSKWHETQKYIVTINKTRIFDMW